MAGAGAQADDTAGLGGGEGNHRKNILIIEDNEAQQESLEVLLGDDFNVFQATDGKKGFDLLQTLPVNLLILDLMLPRMQGTEILQSKEGPSSKKVPVIVITAHNTLERATICAHNKAVDGYFEKPFDCNKLFERVMEILHKDRKAAAGDGRPTQTNPSLPVFFDRLSEPARRGLEYIHSHYTEPIKPRKVAAHVCLSKQHFGKEFKKELHCRVDVYINNLRIDRAKELWGENPDIRPSHMWERLGFSDEYTFLRHFKRRTGLTPTAYREKEREKERWRFVKWGPGKRWFNIFPVFTPSRTPSPSQPPP